MAVGIVAAAVLLLGGCGDDDDDVQETGDGSATGSASGPEADADAPPVSIEGETENHGTATVEGGEIDIELDDFYFGPTFIGAEPGATITVHLTNEGDAPHTFTIDEAGIDEELEPGDTRDVEVTVPEGEATVLYCRFHQAQGMQGALFTTTG